MIIHDKKLVDKWEKTKMTLKAKLDKKSWLSPSFCSPLLLRTVLRLLQLLWSWWKWQQQTVDMGYSFRRPMKPGQLSTSSRASANSHASRGRPHTLNLTLWAVTLSVRLMRWGQCHSCCGRGRRSALKGLSTCICQLLAVTTVTSLASSNAKHTLGLQVSRWSAHPSTSRIPTALEAPQLQPGPPRQKREQWIQGGLPTSKNASF